MNENIEKIIATMDLNPAGSAEAIAEAEKNLNVKFPQEYKDFILKYNGGEGEIGEEGYLVVWSVDDIAQYNEDYDVETYNPGLVYFGSDGGDMAFAFDKRTEDMPIVSIPFDAIELEDMESAGDTFFEFLQNQYNYRFE